VLFAPPPPQATSVAREMHNKTSQPQRRCRLRGLLLRSKKPASGMNATYIGEACQKLLGFSKDAELAGTLMARVNGTGLLSGLIYVTIIVSPPNLRTGSRDAEGSPLTEFPFGFRMTKCQQCTPYRLRLYTRASGASSGCQFCSVLFSSWFWPRLP